jgi:hypothetical protein
MPKLIKCPICTRENPIGNIRCSRCGSYLDIAIKEEAPDYPTKQVKEKEVENILKDLSIEGKKPERKINLEFFAPNETKLFLFINLSFTSLFLHLLVKDSIIFILTYYPTIYWFSCHWATKKKFDWQDFLFQFALIILIFLSLFFLIPQII